MARNAIGTHRRTPAVKALHGLAEFIESAYINDGAGFGANGEQALLRALLPAEFRVAFDVGANFGDWSAEALQLWPNCQIHAFEVAPETFKRLAESPGIKVQPHRVELNNQGLGDAAGTLEMHYYPDHPELTCTSPRHNSYACIPFKANLTTGDQYCDERGIDSIDFLKIDVEGSEYRVINGFSRRLAARKIHCLQFEYGAFSTETRFLLKDYYESLADSFWLGKIFSSYVEFRDYDWTMEDFRFCNYLCVSKDRPDLRALVEG